MADAASSASPDVVVLYEHPEWQEPLFEALRRRGVPYATVDLKSAAFHEDDLPEAPLYFNQASPSAYVRGNTRAVPLALALMEDLEAQGARVLNGSAAFRLELSKAAQVRLMRRLGIDHPRTVAFNEVAALRGREAELTFPAMLKPNQGGSGARMFLIESLDELADLLERQPELWLPDNLLLLQENLPHDTRKDGIIRMEFLGGELLYAMRVLSDGTLNLCPSEVCNPQDGAEGACAIEPGGPPSFATEFLPFPEVPAEAVEAGRRIVDAGGLDVGGIEYLETDGGRRVFYDVNANSNLRRPIGLAMGFDPFERVVDWIEAEIHARASGA
jgi:glutathione synthase/RimK-type ligase-like ATP-grasp enzyme